ncbi:hypothetical protein BKA66DRAFT_437457 [Pyrenochaeta sp. MPI-SDFR-AT-0127]|nr:hypothetical protein BKA66DRAFT_437457 [Pyrenochaeta sp. MPI-SDFR-AT-0127]
MHDPRSQSRCEEAEEALGCFPGSFTPLQRGSDICSCITQILASGSTSLHSTDKRSASQEPHLCSRLLHSACVRSSHCHGTCRHVLQIPAAFAKAAVSERRRWQKEAEPLQNTLSNFTPSNANIAIHTRQEHRAGPQENGRGLYLENPSASKNTFTDLVAQ